MTALAKLYLELWLEFFDLWGWRIWPIEGSIKALVYVQHDCDGAVMLSKIAEVDL